MSANTKRHPFLDDLAEHVVLISSVLRQPVAGRERVLAVVRAGASQYLSQTPRFLGEIGERSYFEYDVGLKDEVAGAGLVSIVRNAGGEVTSLHIAFSPPEAVLSIAAGVREQLEAELGKEMFL